MITYHVKYEIRKNGASGIFYWRTVSITADSYLTARRMAFDQLHADGYETRGGGGMRIACKL